MIGVVIGISLMLGYMLGVFVEKYRSMRSAIEVLTTTKNLALIDKDFQAPESGHRELN